MSRGLTYEKSIKVAANFGYTGAAPLDSRQTVATKNDLDTMPLTQIYESLMVWVNDEACFYIYINDAWEPFSIKSTAASPVQVSGKLHELLFSINAASFKMPVGVTDEAGNVIATQPWVNNKLVALDAMTYKGVITAGSNLPAANAGDTYKCSTAGQISGINVHVGDLLICKVDGTSANTAANWDIICVGDTTGVLVIDTISGTRNDGDIPVFTVTGTVVKNSGINVSNIGKVACADGETKAYLAEQVIPSTTLGTNDYAIKVTHANQKLELSVTIDTIDGGYYD